MSWTINEMPDQTGRVVLVTGANSGLGLETTKAFYKKGAKVVMGCRCLEKGEVSRQKLLKLNYSGNIEMIKIELSDLIELQKGVDLFARKFNSLDTLINNTGVMAPP